MLLLYDYNIQILFKIVCAILHYERYRADYFK